MMGGRAVTRGKGSTTAAGMHVALIVNGPGVAAGNVHDALVDTTDFLPTICEAAEAAKLLQSALDQFKNARPAHLEQPASR